MYALADEAIFFGEEEGGYTGSEPASRPGQAAQ